MSLVNDLHPAQTLGEWGFVRTGLCIVLHACRMRIGIGWCMQPVETALLLYLG